MCVDAHAVNFIHWTFVTRLDPSDFLLMGLSLKDKTVSTKYYIKGNTAIDAFKSWYMLSKLHCGNWSSVCDTSSDRVEGTSDVFLIPHCMSGVRSCVRCKTNELSNDHFKFLRNEMFLFSRSRYHATCHGQWEKYSLYLLFLYLLPSFLIPFICPSRHHSCCVLGMEGNRCSLYSRKCSLFFFLMCDRNWSYSIGSFF
jgi:hypothetical protein